MPKLTIQIFALCVLFSVAGCGLALGPLELPPAVAEGSVPGDEPPIVRSADGSFSASAEVEATPYQRVIYRGTSN